MTPVELSNPRIEHRHHQQHPERERISKRNSNTAEDEVHQRAQLVLQMAMSLETSNHRKNRQLKQIESGKMHHVQQVIDEIMQEQPANLMSILQEVEPELLPTAAELAERYQSKDKQQNGAKDGGATKRRRYSDASEETDQDSDYDEDDEEKSEAEAESPQGHFGSPARKQAKDTEFHKKQDLIIAQAQVPATLPTNIDPDTLQAHTAPLQEQLKRSYEAIVRLRENADLRYEALEEKYNALKRERQVDGAAQKALAEKAGMTPVDLETVGTEPMKEQLTQAYEALIRLRENSELRYNVLEGKYLDLKRSHTESDVRNERLEGELENIRMQLKRARQHNAQLYHNSKKQNANSSASVTGSKKDRKRIRALLLEFQQLSEKVASCQNCQSYISNRKKLMRKLKTQLARIEEEFMNNGEEMTDEESDSDNDESGDDADSDTLSSLSSTRRHDGAMALLGANWETISKIDVSKEEMKPGGRFAHVSESKVEQRLRGKPSQFVACQSGVYCRIDHDMNQYGSLEDRYQKAQPPPPPPPPPQPKPPVAPPSQPVVPVSGVLQSATRNSAMKPALKPAVKPAMKKPLPSLQEDDKEWEAVPKPYAHAQESDQTLPTTCSTKESDSQESSLTLTFGEDSILIFDRCAPEQSADPEDPPKAQQSTEEELVRRTPAPALAKKKSVRGLNGRPGMKKSVSFARRVEVTVEEETEKKPSEEEKTNEARAGDEAQEEQEEKPVPRHLVAPSAPGEGQDEDLIHKDGPELDDENDESESKDEHGNSDEFNRSSLDPIEEMDMSTASSGSNKHRRIPPAKLDPAERKAKKQAALREAKKAAKNVRRENRSRRRVKGEGDDGGSLVSGLSGSSSLATDMTGVSQNSKRGLFSNPFKRKNKSLEDATARTAGIPTFVQKERGPPSSTPSSRGNEFAVEV